MTRAAPLLCLLLIAACGAHLPHATYTPQPQSALVEVARSPPPARVEVVPARPKASSVWVDGEWTWRRERWAWTPGRWVAEPAGAAFSPWVFVRAADGTLWYAPGVWRDTKGALTPAPRALAVATVEDTEVVNAEGATETTGPTLRPGRTRAPAAQPAAVP